MNNLPATFPAGIIGGLGAGMSSGVDAYIKMQHLKSMLEEHHQRTLDRNLMLQMHQMGRSDAEREKYQTLAQKLVGGTTIAPGEQPNAINFAADEMQNPEQMPSRMEALQRQIGGPAPEGSPGNGTGVDQYVQGPPATTDSVPFNQLPPTLQGAVSMGKAERYVKPSSAGKKTPMSDDQTAKDVWLTILKNKGINERIDPHSPDVQQRYAQQLKARFSAEGRTLTPQKGAQYFNAYAQ